MDIVYLGLAFALWGATVLLALGLRKLAQPAEGRS